MSDMEISSAEIRILPQGPTPELSTLTLAVTFSFAHEAVERFKALIPWQERSWNEAQKCWYATPRHLDAIKAFARAFDSAMLIDGTRWVNLRTGAVYEQQELF